jgi:putative oxidoreductase
VPKVHSSYPDGVQGIALLILRLCNAAAAFAVFPRPDAAPLIAAALLITGLGTRYVSFLLGCAAAWGAFASPGMPALALIGQAGGSIALTLLGAGAWSLDARLFGRRVIHLGG